MKKSVKVGIGLAGASLVGLGYYLYDFAISNKEKKFLAHEEDLEESVAKLVKEGEDWVATNPGEELHARSVDGLRLSATYVEPNAPSNQLVILVHGYGATGKDMSSFGYAYHQKGFHVLSPDNRGHGNSEGNYIGFGWHDRQDIMKWIDVMKEKLGDHIHIILHGISMGGATVLMTSGESLPPQVKCIIADCSYTSVNDILSYQLKQMFKLPRFPILPITSAITKLKAGYTFGEVSAIRQVQKATVPILFIHGDADTFVPTEMVYKLYDACPTKKKLLIVPNAEHAMGYFRDPKTYGDTIEGFIKEATEQSELLHA
ncbi:alpha/beta hydrolase [Priestia koreensis]|uniref:alpha/beta hydrolase n=1 Tax=Priestia koreensis TaxID=284581 RepID=UPI0028F6FAA3|nr:alpha/beta hydrolase [Priestia koreensis]